MAETYDQYKRNRRLARERPPVTGVESAISATETRLNAALDQAELLRGVYARVKAFLEIYEDHNKDLLKAAESFHQDAQGIRSAAIAQRMEDTYQEVATVSGYSRPKNPEERLLLDDLKVLLDQMPEGYREA